MIINYFLLFPRRKRNLQCFKLLPVNIELLTGQQFELLPAGIMTSFRRKNDVILQLNSQNYLFYRLLLSVNKNLVCCYFYVGNLIR